MNILGIVCSMRQHSNSEQMTNYLMQRIQDTADKRYNLSVEVVNGLDMNIDCPGCEECFADFQHHQDDLVSLHKKMMNADVIVMASPTYFGMPSSLAKTIMDRTNSIWLEKSFKGKIGAVIVNGAGHFGAIEINAKTIVHYFHDHEMVNVPFYACFSDSVKFPDDKFPLPLSEDIRSGLDRLALEIKPLLRLRTQD